MLDLDQNKIKVTNDRRKINNAALFFAKLTRTLHTTNDQIVWKACNRLALNIDNIETFNETYYVQM